MTNKEEWIEAVENSLNELERAKPRPFLWSRIESRFDERLAANLKPVWIWSAAVGLLVVMLLNLLVIGSSRRSKQEISELKELARELQFNTSESFNYQ